MTKAQKTLKEDIEKINDETIIEKIRIFINWKNKNFYYGYFSTTRNWTIK